MIYKNDIRDVGSTIDFFDSSQKWSQNFDSGTRSAIFGTPKWQNGSFIDIDKELLENIDKVNIATGETSQGITSLAI